MAAVSQNAEERPGGFRRFWRALRELFHEMVGAVFAILALAWLNMALRAYLRDVARWLILTAVGVAALMVIFSWTSFRRSQRVR
jgi:hypothetical protein